MIIVKVSYDPLLSDGNLHSPSVMEITDILGLYCCYLKHPKSYFSLGIEGGVLAMAEC